MNKRPPRKTALGALFSADRSRLKDNWGVYVHIPFCRRKCAYCDFYSHQAGPADRTTYVAALHRHIAEAGEVGRPGPKPQTVFFGGGTPSLLPASLVVATLERLGLRFAVPCFAEVTVEANPGTITKADIRLWRSGGCNRLSLGVQAFQPRLLAFLGRQQSLNDVVRLVKAARQVGFDNLNLDLLYGIPGQTRDDWRLSLQLALALEPTHLSLYNLTPATGTLLGDWLAKGLTLPCPEDDEVAMYEFAREYLAAKGFCQYELSNFARPGYECRHNLNYWQRGDYLGFGSGATSQCGLWRWMWIADSGSYVTSLLTNRPVPIGEEETLSPQVAATEALILGLRRTQGVDLKEVTREYGIGAKIFAEWERISHELALQGWIDYRGNRIMLAPHTYLLANEIMVKYLV
ncbi:MAG: radical SAM family heme chaperone HemW [Heliobacteriaceae bacterium]|nr:radical SAM family heme chaperone HemW [Heliobacteriaceae bacterium]